MSLSSISYSATPFAFDVNSGSFPKDSSFPTNFTPSTGAPFSSTTFARNVVSSDKTFSSSDPALAAATVKDALLAPCSIPPQEFSNCPLVRFTISLYFTSVVSLFAGIFTFSLFPTTCPSTFSYPFTISQL